MEKNYSVIYNIVIVQVEFAIIRAVAMRLRGTRKVQSLPLEWSYFTLNEIIFFLYLNFNLYVTSIQNLFIVRCLLYEIYIFLSKLVYIT